MNRKIFAERLESLRKEKGLLGKELAAMVGVPYGTYSTWESGHRIPRTDMFLKLSNILNVNAHYLAGESDTKNPIKKIFEVEGPLAAHHDGPKGEDLSDLEDIIADAVKKASKWREEKQRK
jgi:transcriptional regulator with XRE-family HTH domain